MHLLLLGLMALSLGDAALALAPKILVLGGTGFIGSTISKIAVDSGCQVTSLSRRGPPSPEGDPIDGVTFLQGDATDPAVLQRVITDGHLEPQCWRLYPHLRPERSPTFPSESTFFPARGGVQSAPTAPNRVERGGWSASAGNSPAGHRGARQGWSAVDGRPTGGSSPGRQQSPSGHTHRNPREGRGTPGHRSSTGLGSRRVARLEPDQPKHALFEDHGDPEGLLPVEERIGISTATSVGGVKTLGNESAPCSIITAKGEIAKSSEMPIALLTEGKVEHDQKAAPTHCCSTTVDPYEQLELVVAEEVVDVPGKGIELVMAAEVFGFIRQHHRACGGSRGS